MSLSKILKAPAKLFKKENISFLIIRRYDLGLHSEDLRYVAVKPSASISVLRQKIWHLLELPDFCEEIIILKSSDAEIPLTALRAGNNPHKPFLLEVWPPKKLPTFKHIMLTMGSEARTPDSASIAECEQKSQAHDSHQDHKDTESTPTLPTVTKTTNKLRPKCANTLPMEFKNSELSCKMSSTSLFFKLNGRKSTRDNFASILLKIQDDLMTLSNKLSTLEEKIKT